MSSKVVGWVLATLLLGALGACGSGAGSNESDASTQSGDGEIAGDASVRDGMLLFDAAGDANDDDASLELDATTQDATALDASDADVITTDAHSDDATTTDAEPQDAAAPEDAETADARTSEDVDGGAEGDAALTDAEFTNDADVEADAAAQSDADPEGDASDEAADASLDVVDAETTSDASADATIVNLVCEEGYARVNGECVATELLEYLDYLKASNTDGQDAFGWHVAISGDGNTIAIGAPNEDSPSRYDADSNTAAGSGAVYVFRFINGVWAPHAFIKPNVADAGDAFGYSVALSYDGNTLAVGAPLEDSGSRGQGEHDLLRVRIDGNGYIPFALPDGRTAYTRDGSFRVSPDGFLISAIGLQLTSSIGVAAGTDARIDADGTVTVLVDSARMPVGSIMLANVDEELLLPISTVHPDVFVLPSEADSPAIGAPGSDGFGTFTTDLDANDERATDSGAVYVFAWAEQMWTQRAYLKASNADAGDFLGTVVSLSSDGHTLLAGAPGEDSAGRSLAASGDIQLEVGGNNDMFALLNAGTGETLYARSVRLHIGADGSLVDANGLSLVFAGSFAGATDIRFDATGYASVIRAGALEAAGRVELYAFEQPEALVSVGQPELGLYRAPEAAGEVTIRRPGVSGAPFLLSASGRDNTTEDSGAAYVFARHGEQWAQERYLKSPDPQPGAAFGSSAEISGVGDTLVVGAPLFDATHASITSAALQIAIAGPGYFQVRNPEGDMRYTRSVSLIVNDDDELATADGLVLQPRIRTSRDIVRYRLSLSGALYATGPDGSENQIAQIFLTTFETPSALSEEGDGLYAETELSGAGTQATPMSSGVGSVYLVDARERRADVGAVFVFARANAALEDAPGDDVFAQRTAGADQYFQVRLPNDAIALRRRGVFRRSSEGMLVDPEGNRYFPGFTMPEGASISIDENGNVSAETTGGTISLGGLVVVTVETPSGLQQIGPDLFVPTASAGVMTQGSPGSPPFAPLSAPAEGSRAWVLETQLGPRVAFANEHFGASVAISHTGASAQHAAMIVVGAPGESSASNVIDGNDENSSSPNAGAAFVFMRSGWTWSQFAYLKASTPDAGDMFGASVDIARAADRILIGAPNESSTVTVGTPLSDDNDTSQSGAVYVFSMLADGAQERGRLKASVTDVEDHFGASVCISDQSNIAVVGANDEDGSGRDVSSDPTNNDANESGAAYVRDAN